MSSPAEPNTPVHEDEELGAEREEPKSDDEPFGPLDVEFQAEDLLVRKKGGSAGRGRDPIQNMDEDHLGIAKQRFFEKQSDKEERITDASESWVRRDPWDKRLLRDVRDYFRILFDQLFHRQKKRRRKAAIRTLLRFLKAPVELMA